MILIILFLITLLIQGIILLIPWFFIQEILISFLPYWLVVDIIILIILLTIRLNKKYYLYHISLIWVIVIGWYTTYLVSQPYIHEPTIDLTDTTPITFFYANIYYQNPFIWDLYNQITSLEPDLVLLVEYSLTHDKTITDKLRERYPYVSRFAGTKWYDGDIIFSKYPFTTFQHEESPSSFSHITLQVQSNELDVALLHTSAPISEEFWKMRWWQLSNLNNILQPYQKSNKPLLLLWDFNLTPWSIEYKKLDTTLQSLNMINYTTDLHHTRYKNNIPITRCHQLVPYACAPIDHIRSTQNIIMRQISVLWSDHTWFYGTIYLR